MSYILDALRKVERDRSQPEVPNINLGSVNEQPSRQRWGIILLIGLVAMNLGWFVYTTISQQSITEEKSLVVTPNDVSKKIEGGQKGSETLQAGFNDTSDRVEHFPSITNAGTESRQSKNSSPQSIAELMTKTTQLNAPKPDTVKALVAKNPERSKTFLNKSNTIKPARPALNTAPTRAVNKEPVARAKSIPKRVQETALKKSQADITRPSVEVRKTPQIVKQIPMLRQMPADFQEQIPEININVYVHDDNVANAFVIINMRKYRIGDRINPDIELIDIGVDGITLSKDGKEFQVARP